MTILLFRYALICLFCTYNDINHVSGIPRNFLLPILKTKQNKQTKTALGSLFMMQQLFEFCVGSYLCNISFQGKSSLSAALFRLVELSDGNIIVDQEDISNLHLSSIRSNISTITQDPVLFNGTIR